MSESTDRFGTRYAQLFAALMAPFPEEALKTRTQAGQTLTYITARVAMNRLDDVVGPENWWDEYESREDSVVCRLSIRLPDGQVLTKADAGGYAGMKDPGDDDKSGFSDAFKRAAVKFGIARYLYRDGMPEFAREIVKGKRKQARAEPPAEAPAVTKAFREAADVEAATPITGGAGGAIGTEPANAPDDPQALLNKGDFLAWLPAFIRKANATFAEQRPDLAGTIVLVERDQLLSFLADRAGDAIPADARGSQLPDLLARVFDRDPAAMHELGRDFYRQRSGAVKGLKKGLKKAS